MTLLPVTRASLRMPFEDDEDNPSSPPLLPPSSREDPRYTAEILLGLEIKSASTPHPTQTWHRGDGSDAFEPKWRTQSYHTAAEIEHFNAPPF